MSSDRKHNRYNNRYRTDKYGKSIFDGSPTLTISRYRIPKPYLNAVNDVLTAYKQGIPFNRAVDQVATLDPDHINRNKLAEHALKTIANDY